MSERPNIIFILTDQQRFDTIRALGFPHVDTPNLDRLAGEGVSFSNCFVTAASCAPARGSLFTGHYAHTTGILKNGDPWRHSWVEDLADAGYHCVNVGKMHTFPYTTPLGFHQRYVVENKDRHLEGRYFFDEWDKALKAEGIDKPGRLQYRNLPDYRQRLGAFEWPIAERLHPDVFVGRTARWWLRSYPPTKPLFLQIGFPGPHPPYDPTREALEPYLNRDLPLLPQNESEFNAMPEPLLGMIRHNEEVDHDAVVHQQRPSEEQRRRQRAHYLANVSMIDSEVGQILETLDETGYLENSVVIFSSDHGDCLTDHGHSQKWTMYDCVTRVPLLVWSPGRFEGGRTVESLCQHMDIGPAILEMAGTRPRTPLAARSLLPALEGDGAWAGREAVFAEQARDHNFTTADYMTMVRTERWKMVHLLGSDDGQLFDLENDRDEVRNLWSDPALGAVRGELTQRVFEWRLEAGLSSADWAAAWR